MHFKLQVCIHIRHMRSQEHTQDVNTQHMEHICHMTIAYRPAIGGRAGIPPGAAIAEPGPRRTYEKKKTNNPVTTSHSITLSHKRTCFCCDRSNSSIWARSISNKIGANNIIELVKKIHDALQENLYTFLTLCTEKCVTLPHTVCTGCGNISVRPHKRSAIVSSGSWNQQIWIVEHSAHLMSSRCVVM